MRTFRRWAIALPAIALALSGCGGDDSANADTEVAGVTQTPLPTPPAGYEIEADGEVWIMSNTAPLPDSTVVVGDGVALGGGTVQERAVEVVSVTPTGDSSIDVAFACVRDSSDRVHSVEYSYDGSTLTVYATILGGYEPGEPCVDDTGASLELPLGSEWNPDAEVVVSAIR